MQDAKNILSLEGESEELSGYVDEVEGTSSDFLFNFSTAMTILGDPMLPESSSNSLSHHVVVSSERELVFKFILKLGSSVFFFSQNRETILKQNSYQPQDLLNGRDYVILDRQFRV